MIHASFLAEWNVLVTAVSVQHLDASWAPVQHSLHQKLQTFITANNGVLRMCPCDPNAGVVRNEMAATARARISNNTLLRAPPGVHLETLHTHG